MTDVTLNGPLPEILQGVGAWAACLGDARPEAVVKPESTKEVAAIVKLASEWKIPIVQHGGGTGVMGGTIPVRSGIVIDLKGLNRILKISPEDRTALVEAGVVLEDLEKALNREGFPKGH